MRLVYFGSGAFGLPTLGALAAGHQIDLIVTQPDRPAGRGGRLTPTPIGAWASEHLPEVPILKAGGVNERAIVEGIRGLGADAWVVIAFGQKLGRALLDGRFAVNLHASRLPRWRGAAPINAAILAGDAVTGNSVITLAERMDAGLVLAQSEREIGPATTAGELHDMLASDGPALVLGVLGEHAAGSLRPVEQDESRVTLAPKLSRDDAWVDFAGDAEECRRRINGLSAWPGVQVTLGSAQVKLLRATAEDRGAAGGAPPGSLIDPGEGLVACGRGVLRLLEVHPAGKRPMAWADFARGHALRAGVGIVSGGEAGPC